MPDGTLFDTTQATIQASAASVSGPEKKRKSTAAHDVVGNTSGISITKKQKKQSLGLALRSVSHLGTCRVVTSVFGIPLTDLTSRRGCLGRVSNPARFF